MTGLGWLSIVRLGLVQTAIGAIVVLTTSTLNRIMVVEYGLAVTVPAALVAFHYAVQLSRARWGYGSDGARRRTPWIVGGMTVLAAGALLAAWATPRIATPWGIALAIAAFAAIGVGVGAAGTSLLALLAAGVDHDDRRLHRHHRGRWPAARSVLPGAVAGGRRRRRRRRVDARRRRVAGVEPAATPGEAAPRAGFEAALREIWADRRARRFTIFVVVSMLAYSAQKLIIEPFAGLLFGFTPGQSTSLAALQHGGGLVGMVSVGVFGSLFGRRDGWLRSWIVGGCIALAVALGGLACATLAAPHWPLQPTVFVLGVANGVFAVAAVGSMMGLAGGGGLGAKAYGWACGVPRRRPRSRSVGSPGRRASTSAGRCSGRRRPHSSPCSSSRPACSSPPRSSPCGSMPFNTQRRFQCSQKDTCHDRDR